MRKGGTARDLRRLALWCSLLTALGILIYSKTADIKKTYTDLHRRVHVLERWVENH